MRPGAPYSVYRRHIPETVVAGKPLGRHVEHDSRSKLYQLYSDGTDQSIIWPRHTSTLDQGDVGSCTGNAETGLLGTDPFWTSLAAQLAAGLTLDEQLALGLYSDAENIDGDGPYPPNDNGSSGLSVAKAAKNRGLISGYVHMLSLDACKTAIGNGPFITGVNWYTSMDQPDSSGLVVVNGTVRGGHEFLCRERDARNGLWWFDNSWGTGFGAGGRFCMSDASYSRLLSEDGDATQSVPLSVTPPIPQPPQPPEPGSVTRSFAAADDQALQVWADHPHIWHTATVAAKAWQRSRVTT